MPSFGFDTTRISLWKWCLLGGAGQHIARTSQEVLKYYLAMVAGVKVLVAAFLAESGLISNPRPDRADRPSGGRLGGQFPERPPHIGGICVCERPQPAVGHGERPGPGWLAHQGWHFRRLLASVVRSSLLHLRLLLELRLADLRCSLLPSMPLGFAQRGYCSMHLSPQDDAKQRRSCRKYLPPFGWSL